MREIEFRGKSKFKNTWVYGKLLNHKRIITQSDDETEEMPCFDMCDYQEEVCENTIGQYTGLKDKNGKKIFEGDIVKPENGFYEGLYNYVEIEEDEYYAVYYDEEYARYDLQTTDNNTEFKRVVWYQLVNAKVEVIGNIYDNPELLGEEL